MSAVRGDARRLNLRRYISTGTRAALTTLLGIGAELAAPENRQNGNRIVIAGRDGLQDSVNQVGQEMTRRNMNIQPTLTARPGLPVRIIVARDLQVRAYQPLFLQRGGAR